MKLLVLLLSFCLLCGCQQQEPVAESPPPSTESAAIVWEELDMTVSCQLSPEEVISKEIDDQAEKKRIGEMLSQIYYEELGCNPQTGGEVYIVDAGDTRYAFNHEAGENRILVFVNGEGDHYLNQSWAGLSFFFERYLFRQDLMESEETIEPEVDLCGYPLKRDDEQPPVSDIPAFEPVEGILSEMLYLENGIEYSVSPEYWYEVSTWLENHAVAEVQDKPSASGERVKITFIDGTVRGFDLHSTMIDNVSYGLMRPGPKPEALKNPENGVSLSYKQPYEQAAKAVQQFVLARDVNLDEDVDLSQWAQEDACRLMETKIELQRWSHEQAAIKEENQRLTIYPCMTDKWREGNGITVYVQVVRSWNYVGHDSDSGSAEVMEVTVDKASGRVISCYNYGDKGWFGELDIRYQMALENGDDPEQLLKEFKQQYKGE